MSNNILEFISIEHYNELVSIANLKGELGFLQELDDLYQDTKETYPIDTNNNVHFMTSVMLLQAHNEFYIGIAQLLKSNLGKAFFSLRIAIDASFNTYYFTQNPKHTEDFSKEDSLLQAKIFWRIKDHIKKNPKQFPLAQQLTRVHEVASHYSAHASFVSLAYKYQRISAVQKKEINLSYFDILKHEEYLAFYFTLLKGYFMVFQLFDSCFFKKEFKIEYPTHNKRILDLEAKLNLKAKQYPLRRKKE